MAEKKHHKTGKKPPKAPDVSNDENNLNLNAKDITTIVGSLSTLHSSSYSDYSCLITPSINNPDALLFDKTLPGLTQGKRLTSSGAELNVHAFARDRKPSKPLPLTGQPKTEQVTAVIDNTLRDAHRHVGGNTNTDQIPLEQLQRFYHPPPSDYENQNAIPPNSIDQTDSNYKKPAKKRPSQESNNNKRLSKSSINSKATDASQFYYHRNFRNLPPVAEDAENAPKITANVAADSSGSDSSSDGKTTKTTTTYTTATTPTTTTATTVTKKKKKSGGCFGGGGSGSSSDEGKKAKTAQPPGHVTFSSKTSTKPGTKDSDSESSSESEDDSEETEKSKKTSASSGSSKRTSGDSGSTQQSNNHTKKPTQSNHSGQRSAAGAGAGGGGGGGGKKNNDDHHHHHSKKKDSSSEEDSSEEESSSEEETHHHHTPAQSNHSMRSAQSSRRPAPSRSSCRPPPPPSTRCTSQRAASRSASAHSLPTSRCSSNHQISRRPTSQTSIRNQSSHRPQERYMSTGASQRPSEQRYVSNAESYRDCDEIPPVGSISVGKPFPGIPIVDKNSEYNKGVNVDVSQQYVPSSTGGHHSASGGHHSASGGHHSASGGHRSAEMDAASASHRSSCNRSQGASSGPFNNGSGHSLKSNRSSTLDVSVNNKHKGSSTIYAGEGGGGSRRSGGSASRGGSRGGGSHKEYPYYQGHHPQNGQHTFTPHGAGMPIKKKFSDHPSNVNVFVRKEGNEGYDDTGYADPGYPPDDSFGYNNNDNGYNDYNGNYEPSPPCCAPCMPMPIPYPIPMPMPCPCPPQCPPPPPCPPPCPPCRPCCCPKRKKKKKKKKKDCDKQWDMMSMYGMYTLFQQMFTSWQNQMTEQYERSRPKPPAPPPPQYGVVMANPCQMMSMMGGGGCSPPVMMMPGCGGAGGGGSMPRNSGCGANPLFEVTGVEVRGESNEC